VVAPSLAAPTARAHHPNVRSSAALASVLGLIVATGCTSAPSRAEGSSVTAHGAQADVTVVHQHLENGQVDLYPIPDGYEPGVDAERALTLGLEQLGGQPRVTKAQLYLGEFRIYGTPESAIPAWVMVVGPSSAWCVPATLGTGSSGSGGATQPSETACYFGVVLNAGTGAFVVAG
jgi:hypothetical protein